MRYSYPVLKEYDNVLLGQEFRGQGLQVRVHSGGGRLVLETDAPLSADDIIRVRGVLDTHAPIWFAWTEDGIPQRKYVNCAEDVDRITAQRIRRSVGGQDPIQEQLKAMRQAIWALEVNGRPQQYSPEERALAAQRRGKMLTDNTLIESIRLEGKNFKISRGW